MATLQKLLILCASLLLAGCATKVGQSRVVVIGFGIVTTQGPTNAAAVKVDSTIVGAGVNQGVTLGFKKSSTITINTNANVIIDSSPHHTTIHVQ